MTLVGILALLCHMFGEIREKCYPGQMCQHLYTTIQLPPLARSFR